MCFEKCLTLFHWVLSLNHYVHCAKRIMISYKNTNTARDQIYMQKGSCFKLDQIVKMNTENKIKVHDNISQSFIVKGSQKRSFTVSCFFDMLLEKRI